MKKHYLACAFSASLLIIGSANAQLNLLNYTSTSGYVPQIGGGYSSDTQNPAPVKCFNVTTDYVGNKSNLINLGDNISFSQLESSLNINVSGSGSYGLFSASASANYLHQVKEDNYSRSFSYSELINFPVSQINPAGYSTSLLNNFGRQVYSDPENFRLVCGDEIITQISTGASLYITMKMNFSSKEEKTQFDAEAKGSYSLFNASAKMQEIIKKYNMSGSVALLAYQIGGDPSKLANIFSKSPSGGYYITSCNFKNLGNCTSAINGFLSYAHDDFSKQVSMKDGNIAGNAVPTGPYEHGTLSMFGLNTGKTLATPEVLQARKELASSYIINTNYLNHINHLIDLTSGYGQLTATHSDLQSLQQKLAQNSLTLNNAGSSCYQNPSSCINATNQAKSNLIDISKQIEPYKYQWTYTDTYGGTTTAMHLQSHELFIAQGSNPATRPAVISNVLEESPTNIHFKGTWQADGNSCDWKGTGTTEGSSIIYKGYESCAHGGTPFILTKTLVQ
ncbi:hypothetical protein [Piscirickettsia litoralis]|uniref:Uncharacterized protein n=1 Tax=Piscirickettsia litoralis TaxID=1891921 RepID=A0ABX3A374_9GAMM|nr:hypothetical protein [Piscirickettsia litoralis]ODN41825.1 hypothetical protein BGC07_01080 [Piscirickettsia litoralis]